MTLLDTTSPATAPAPPPVPPRPALAPHVRRRRVGRRRLALGLAFLAPNIVGFLAFTLVPLVLSLAMAFTNWNLLLHSRFKGESLAFVGLDNFRHLFGQPDFWRFLGNTLVLMLGIPVSIAGSLGLALLLNGDLAGRSATARRGLAIGATGLIVLAVPVAWLLAGPLAALLALAATGTLLAGLLAGPTFYRTVFYLPHFTAGVATILLWKNLLNPQIGPINAALSPILRGVATVVNALPAGLVRAGLWACLALLLLAIFRLAGAWARQRRDDELGWIGLTLGATFALVPIALARSIVPMPAAIALWIGVAIIWVPRMSTLIRARSSDAGRGTDQRTDPWHPRSRADEGLGGALLIGCGVCALGFALLGLGALFDRLPAMAADGLAPPGWHTNYHWAKPALILIGVWAAVGSNNLLLYLAGLSNVPVELYEAADLDGATGRSRFWHVTWPQLAPTTFFIVVMSVIGGLQGGFEVARTMTKGGPDGATTTLSYFIYEEGFVTGRLGFSSAVAWTLFLMVLAVTLFNWTFGNRYAND